MKKEFYVAILQNARPVPFLLAYRTRKPNRQKMHAHMF